MLSVKGVEVGGVHVSKESGDIKKGRLEKKEGLIHLSALCTFDEVKSSSLFQKFHLLIYPSEFMTS